MTRPLSDDKFAYESQARSESEGIIDTTVQSIRIYGSKHWFGLEARTNPIGGPISEPGYPSSSHTLTFRIGEFPNDLYYDANLVGLALNLTPWADGNLSLDQAIVEEFINREKTDPTWLKPPITEWNCYVTLSIEHQIHLEEEFVIDRAFGWIKHEKALTLRAEHLKFSQPNLNRVA